MDNIVIYTNKETSELLEPLSKIEDTSVRVVSSDDIKGYTLLNVSLMVIEQAENLKDVLMTTKFTCPILFVGDIFTDITIRSEGYDFIKTPVNETELLIRAKALLKIKQYKDKMEEISVTDELTGLHNRKYLQERLESEISRARRYKTQLSCLLFDIDFFKVINDMYGYEWGDILLRNLSGKLQQLIRKEDILTRYGDEEFLVVLPNTSEDNAFLFAERFRRDIERMEFIPAGEEERHPITISGGIATYPCMENVDEDANTIIRYAEHALYNAKKRGKNKIVQFTQINLEF
ncbi:GGDEF domain-containing protein [bacterium]|nr:GGDEF domain-containing protein [bacterium]